MRNVAWRGLVGGALAAAVSWSVARANEEHVLYRFTGGADGGHPFVGVVRDSAGNLYGATAYGGGGFCGSGCGVIFKLAPNGVLTVLHTLQGLGEGAFPSGDLILDRATGNIYGTAYQGGNQGCGGRGCGTIFQLAPDGTLTALHIFSERTDGNWPDARLLRDQEHNFYGTARSGGPNGSGTIFKLDSNRKLTVLHSFSGTDGLCPTSRLRKDRAGNLYGTAGSECTDSLGTVFELHSGGAYQVLHAFTGGTDGANPWSGLTRDRHGNFYGTAGGGSFGNGVVYKLARDGSETILHAFSGGSDGSVPLADLRRGRNGTFYGTTLRGGDNGAGTVFKITPRGRFKTLYSFKGGDDGQGPLADLIEDDNGNLYGTTEGGGTGSGNGNGTIFTVKE